MCKIRCVKKWIYLCCCMKHTEIISKRYWHNEPQGQMWPLWKDQTASKSKHKEGTHTPGNNGWRKYPASSVKLPEWKNKYLSKIKLTLCRIYCRGCCKNRNLRVSGTSGGERGMCRPSATLQMRGISRCVWPTLADAFRITSTFRLLNCSGRCFARKGVFNIRILW